MFNHSDLKCLVLVIFHYNQINTVSSVRVMLHRKTEVIENGENRVQVCNVKGLDSECTTVTFPVYTFKST